ncbi:MAG: MarR family winged helix-turn-helix transcriptional regulator [bacterium]|nr:MarR family winged helix-turn-helix transcriptional regulator [bacterium]
MGEIAEPHVSELAGFLGRLTRLSHVASRDDADCCGVTVAQCHILLSLLEAGKTTMQSLSSRLGIAPSTLTRNIEPLVTNGWILRERADDDRRRVVVELSSEGQEKANELKSVRLETCQRLLEGLPASERETVLGAMSTLLTALEIKLIERRYPEEGAEYVAPLKDNA